MRALPAHGIAAWRSAGGTSQERRHDVRGVAVERSPAPVVAHGGTRISVAGRLLNVAKSDPGVKCGGDEGMPEGVGTDPLGDPGSTGKALYGAVGGIAVDPTAPGPEEDRPRRSLADVKVNRPGRTGERTVACLPPLRKILRVR